jgi:hypothetical protein
MQCVMRTAFRAETEARCREGRVENRFQDLQERLLNQPVNHRRDAPLAHPAARLRDFHPANRLRLVAAVQQRGDQRFTVRRDPRQQVGDGHPVNPRRTTIRFDPFVRSVQVRRTGDLFHHLLWQSSGSVPRRGRLPLLGRPRVGSAGARIVVAPQGLPGLVEEVPLTPAALLLLPAHRKVRSCSLTTDTSEPCN